VPGLLTGTTSAVVKVGSAGVHVRLPAGTTGMATLLLIIWTAGLGPISEGSDASGAGLGVNMTSIPLTVWLGNVQVTAVCQGVRSD
jgi:hypothetical protein